MSHPAIPRFAPADAGWRRTVTDWGIRGVSTCGSIANRLLGPRTDGKFGILLYHRIADEVEGIEKPTINVTPGRFESQIRGLVQAGYVFWPLKRVLDRIEAGEAIPPYVTVLTFDDGFAGVYENAWPILRDLNIPATVFLATAYSDSDDPFPFDHWGIKHSATVLSKAYRPMTLAECHHLHDSGLIDFGAHTHTHEDFRDRPEDFRRDLETNLDKLKELFGVTEATFAFPYGTPRLGFSDSALCEVTRSLRVRCALTTHSSLNQPTDSRFGWGRFTAFEWDSASMLASKLGGWYGWAPAVKNRLLGRKPKDVDAQPRAHSFGSETVSKSARPTSEGEPGISDKMQISIVVPTFNRAEWLGEALQSLIKQRTDERFQYEIVVCDNASADDTQDVVAAAAASSDIPIRDFCQSKPGDAPTRNHALQHATGDWIAFFDDDQLAPEDWLLQLVAAAKDSHGEIVGGAVHLELSDEERAKYGDYVCEALRETKLYPQLQPYTGAALPGTGNAFVKRTVFDRLGQFDEAFVNGGSDFDFFSRARVAGIPIWYTPKAIIQHRVEPSRLTIEHLRLDALSGGSEHAEHIDFKKSGLGRVAGCALARILQAALIHVPLMVAAWLNHDRGGVLGRRIRLWRTEGYLRKFASLAAPTLFAQERFYNSMTFRHGRPDTSSAS